jgi:hypothetical protein
MVDILHSLLRRVETSRIDLKFVIAGVSFAMIPAECEQLEQAVS